MTTTEAAKNMISDDIIGFIDTIYIEDKNVASAFMMGGLLYYATVISGAIDWCRKANISITPSVSEDTLEKLRAKIKLYSSDKAIPFSEQEIIMNRILAVEKQYWANIHKNNAQWYFQFLYPDIGIYKLNNHIIGNTIGYAYEYSPLNKENLPILSAISSQDRKNAPIYLLAIDIGKTLNELSIALQCKESFSHNNRTYNYTIRNSDFRMKNKPFLRKTNSIYALNLLCRINYLLELFIPICRFSPLLAFRMTYITFYHLKTDLDVLGLDFIHYKMPYRDRYFRNAMAHYSLHGKITNEEINENVIGYGLFEKFFKHSFKDVNDAIIFELKQTRDSLEKYVKI